MGVNRGICHIVVTPSRNESSFLPDLISSMVRQTITPTAWVIVDHNSNDSSEEIILEAVAKFDWIHYLHIENESKRRRGAQIAGLFNSGLSAAEHNWDFCSKIDADMVLPNDYFEEIFERFSENSILGIASGSCFVINGDRRKFELVSKDHTRGGLKTYKRACFDEIGGIREVDGWDGIDNIMAQMNGWQTANFPMIQAHHRRITGSFYGLTRGCFESGKFAYSMRYFFPFMVVRSIHRSTRKPVILGGIFMLAGYLFALFSRSPPVANEQVVRFLRKKQRRRFLFWKGS